MEGRGDDVTKAVHSGTVEHVSRWDYVLGGIRGHLGVLGLTALSVVSVLYMVVDIGERLDLMKLTAGLVFGAFVPVAVVAGAWRAWQAFRESVPEGLEAESKETRRCFRRRARFWEFTLAAHALKRRIARPRARVDLLRAGMVFCGTPRRMGDIEYMDWIHSRMAGLTAMVAASSKISTEALGPALLRSGSVDEKLLGLLGVADSLQEIYDAAVEFEVEGRRVVVPDSMRRAHELTNGWADVVRKHCEDLVVELERIGREGVLPGSTINLQSSFSAPADAGEVERVIDEANNRIARGEQL